MINRTRIWPWTQNWHCLYTIHLYKFKHARTHMPPHTRPAYTYQMLFLLRFNQSNIKLINIASNLTGNCNIMSKLSIKFITKRTIYCIYFSRTMRQCNTPPCASNIKAAGNPVFHVHSLCRSPTLWVNLSRTKWSFSFITYV